MSAAACAGRARDAVKKKHRQLAVPQSETRAPVPRLEWLPMFWVGACDEAIRTFPVSHLIAHNGFQLCHQFAAENSPPLTVL